MSRILLAALSIAVLALYIAVARLRAGVRLHEDLRSGL